MLMHHQQSSASASTEVGWSESQKPAVEHGTGPLLVLAGPGSGKTRVLIGRIAHLVNTQQVDPSQILAVTFTRRAADEMRTRLAAELHETAAQVWLGTLHSFCNRLLRKHSDLVGRSGQFTIYDEKESLGRLEEAAEELFASYDKDNEAPDLGDDFNLAKATQLAMSLAKNQMLTPDMWLNQQPNPEDPYAIAVAKNWCCYEIIMQRQDAFDFDDLLTKAVEVMSHGSVRELERRNWPWILVDEAQDLSATQSKLIYLLSGAGGNVTLVGDEDQQIYSWRGADGELMLRFRDYYPNGHEVYLVENFRSGAVLLRPAAQLITNNPGRTAKPAQIAQKQSGSISLQKLKDVDREAAATVQEIKALREHNPNGTVLVLGRSGWVIKDTYKAIVDAGIPCVKLGGRGSMERAQAQDALAILRLISNPADVPAFERIIGQIPGAGPSALYSMKTYAQAHSVDLIAAMMAADEAEKARIRTKTASLLVETGMRFAALRVEYEAGRSVAHIVAEALQLPHGPVDRTQRQLVDEKEETRDQALIILEELRGLVRAAADYETGTLPDLIADLQLDGTATSTPGDSKTVVSSVHSSKGLEADLVIIVGFNQGAFPSQRALTGEPGKLEEERRAAYVALTRAKERMVVMFPAVRWGPDGRRQFHTVESMFIGEGDIQTTTLSTNEMVDKEEQEVNYGV